MSVSEGMLLGALSFSDSLSNGQRTALIVLVFMLLFSTLLVFYQFVTKHHKKLYAPWEFRSDQAFMETLSPYEQKIKRMLDVQEFEASNLTETEKPTKPSAVEGENKPESSRSDLPQKVVKESQVKKQPERIIDATEDRVMILIDRCAPGTLSRDLKLRQGSREVWIDGVYITDEQTVAIEVKRLSRRVPLGVLKHAVNTVVHATSMLQSMNQSESVRGLLVIVASGDVGDVESQLDEHYRYTKLGERLSWIVLSENLLPETLSCTRSELLKKENVKELLASLS